MTENDFAQLKALGEHRKSVGPAIEIDDKRVEHDDGEGYTRVLLSAHWRCAVYVFNDYAEIDIETGNRNYLDINSESLDTVIALLTRARQIMAERGT